MSSRRLGEAIELLQSAYGTNPSGLAELAPRRWRTLLDVVAGASGRGKADEPGIALSDPEAVLTAPLEVVGDALKRTGRDRRRAAALKALAAWWPGDVPQTTWCDSEVSRRAELTAIRGVGPELVDRILLFVLEMGTMPLSRGALRVVCRHGWCGMESEYEEWQHIFRQASEVAGTTLKETSVLFARVGRDHCGSRPRCDGCPLEPLLPEGGVYEPEVS